MSEEEPPFDAVWDRPIQAPELVDHPWEVTAERLAELKTMTYRDYRTTPEWRSRRREMLKWRQHKCERCGHDSAYLQVHHRSYDRFGCEQPEDLEVLCGKCHRREHGLQP